MRKQGKQSDRKRTPTRKGDLRWVTLFNLLLSFGSAIWAIVTADRGVLAFLGAPFAIYLVAITMRFDHDKWFSSAEPTLRDIKADKNAEASVMRSISRIHYRNAILALNVYLVHCSIFISWAIIIELAVPWVIILAPLACVCLAMTKATLIEYRIRRAFYGRSEREAREILQFILRDADESDGLGGGRRRLMTDQDLSSLEDSIRAQPSPNIRPA